MVAHSLNTKTQILKMGRSTLRQPGLCIMTLPQNKQTTKITSKTRKEKPKAGSAAVQALALQHRCPEPM